MKFIFIITLLFAGIVHAQVWEQSAETADNVPTDFEARPFVASDFLKYPWLKEYTNVVVINKAESGSDRQTLRLYINGKLAEITKISSGRETFEKGCAPGQDPKIHHCSIRPYWSTTPVGYFDVDKLDENYFSNLWKTWMPFAVFFESGIATHQAPAGTEPNLGKRASGGCVRMHPNYAALLFSKVKSAGTGLIPVVKRDGTLKTTAQGDVVRTQGYKTLVIVQNVVK